MTVRHRAVFCCSDAEKEEYLEEAVWPSTASGNGKVLVFTRDRKGCRALYAKLASKGVQACELHSDLTQRPRDMAVEDFRGGRARVNGGH